MALQRVLRFWPIELELRDRMGALARAKSCLKRMVRLRAENKRERDIHRRRWGAWFEAYDRFLHGTERAAGVFTFEEFSQMISVVRRHEKFPKPTDELAMQAFNAWNDNLDPGVNGADYHDPTAREDGSHKIDQELAAVKFQNAYRLHKERLIANGTTKDFVELTSEVTASRDGRGWPAGERAHPFP